MLALHLEIGESLLAHGEWQVDLLSNDGGNCRFRVTSLRPLAYTVRCVSGDATGVVQPESPLEFVAQYGATIMLGQASMSLWKFRVAKGSVKLAITAPKSLRFSRPVQHGGSLTGV